MKSNCLMLLAILFCMLSCGNSNESSQLKTAIVAQNKAEPARFEEEIKAFELEDNENGIAEAAILFTGSSSIRKWNTLESDMTPLPVLNRGFGGATTPELQNFAPRFLYNQKPSILVFYCGENDISEGASVGKAFSSFVSFHKEMRDSMGQIPFVFVSMKPSISRWSMWPEFEEANADIRKYLESDSSAVYLDVSDIMIVNGEADKSIFLDDNLHMNAEGYRRWTKLIKPILLDLLQTN